MRDVFSLSHFLGLAAIAAALVATAPGEAKRVSPGHQVSWGKAGVSLADYRTDAAACGHQAAALDLTGTPPAKALVLASRMLEDPIDGLDVERSLRMAPADVQWARAAALMEDELESCLTGRGYRKFRLTEDQNRKLKQFEPGSEERRVYLHSLASDAAILDRQGLGT